MAEEASTKDAKVTRYDLDLIHLMDVGHNYFANANGRTCHCRTAKGTRCKNQLVQDRAVCQVHLRKFFSLQD